MGTRILLLSDLHLGSRHPHLGAGDEARSRQVLETFRSAVNHAIEPGSGIDAVILAGNVFERHQVEPEIWAFARGLLGRLVAARKRVIAISGPRDSIAYRDSVFRTERWPGVDVLAAAAPEAPLSLDLGGQLVHVHGYSFQRGRSPREFPGFAAADAPGVHIGVVNAVPRGHAEEGLRIADQTLDEDAIASSGVSLLVCGGLHGRHEVVAGPTRAVWPGTLEGRRFETGDLGKRELTIAAIADDGSITLERRPASPWMLTAEEIDLEAEDVRSADALLAALAARAGDTVLARVRLRGRIEFLADMASIEEEAARAFHHLELVDETTLVGSRLLERLLQENTIRGIYARRMSERLEKARTQAGRSADERLVRRVQVLERALRIGLGEFVELETPRPAMFPATEARRAPSAAAPSVRITKAPDARRAIAHGQNGAVEMSEEGSR